MKFFESNLSEFEIKYSIKNNEIENNIECYQDNFFVENRRNF